MMHRHAVMCALGALLGLAVGNHGVQAAESSAPASANSALPDDAFKPLVTRACLSCHPVEIVTAQKRTPDKWDEILARMKGHGATATEDELDQIYTYLLKYFNSEAVSKP